VHAPIRETTRGERALTPLAFKRLLEWLDGGIDSRGETYLEMRRRLVSYFDRRNRLSADELADETLNRIARTLEQGGVIRVTPPARYCYVVARFVLLEDVRRERMHVRVDAPQRLDLPSEWRRGLPEREAGLALREQRLDCLDCCLQKLQPEQRELVVEYYRDALRQKIDRRRHMAKRLVQAGADGLVLFNRFYQPDVDLDELDVRPRIHLSTPQTMRLPMRWIAILHGRIEASLAATGGVHTHEDVLKMLLVGADATMLCSALLKHGIGHLGRVKADLIRWMEEHEFSSVSMLKGSLSQKSCPQPDDYERANYTKALTGYHVKL